nr:hypothetical protein [Candidatus Photodesmus katoptron]
MAIIFQYISLNIFIANSILEAVNIPIVVNPQKIANQVNEECQYNLIFLLIKICQNKENNDENDRNKGIFRLYKIGIASWILKKENIINKITNQNG